MFYLICWNLGTIGVGSQPEEGKDPTDNGKTPKDLGLPPMSCGLFPFFHGVKRGVEDEYDYTPNLIMVSVTPVDFRSQLVVPSVQAATVDLPLSQLRLPWGDETPAPRLERFAVLELEDVDFFGEFKNP